jgi:hypothetical protein
MGTRGRRLRVFLAVLLVLNVGVLIAYLAYLADLHDYCRLYGSEEGWPGCLEGGGRLSLTSLQVAWFILDVMVLIVGAWWISVIPPQAPPAS